MDIPRVLQQLHPGIFWGPQSSTSNTYAEFSAYWPDSNPTIPTEAEMETKWAEIETADALLPTPADVVARLNTHIGTSTPKLRALLILLLEEKLESDPSYLKRNGIDI